MKFTVNDKTYFVKWEYIDHSCRKLVKKNETQITTVCKIYDTATSYNDPLVIGGAHMIKGDRFCKNTGRKISLDRALNGLFPDTLTMHGDLFPKQAQEIAWVEYYKESPKRLK
jgi:hypothetical protein